MTKVDARMDGQRTNLGEDVTRPPLLLISLPGYSYPNLKQSHYSRMPKPNQLNQQRQQ